MSALLRQSQPKHSGFTLLEVLIALSIFSLIGLAAYRMLDIVILSQSKVISHENKTRALERAIYIIGADFEQIINRPVRDNYGDELKAVTSNEGNYLIEFTRQGWRNPLQLPRSQLQRVAYELGNISDTHDSGSSQEADIGVHLLRHYWPVLDRAQDSEPRTQVLLRNVDNLQLNFLDQDGEWQSQWPADLPVGLDQNESSTSLPKALLLKIDSQTLGQIERIFQINEFTVELNQTGDTNPDNNDPQDKNGNTRQPDPANGSGAKP